MQRRYVYIAYPVHSAYKGLIRLTRWEFPNKGKWNSAHSRTVRPSWDLWVVDQVWYVWNNVWPVTGAGYWLRHPYLRIMVVLTIMSTNIMLFVEDPTFHSVLEVDIPVAGQAIQLLALRWPPVCTHVSLPRRVFGRCTDSLGSQQCGLHSKLGLQLSPLGLEWFWGSSSCTSSSSRDGGDWRLAN